MAGRPHWYQDHPPACTCVRCVGRRFDYYKGSRQPRSRGPRSRARHRKPWIVLAAIGVAIGLAFAWNWAYEQDVEVAVTAWEEVETASDRVESFLQENLSELEDGTVAGTSSPSLEPTKGDGSGPLDVVAPSQRHLEEKHYMLALINTERQRSGLAPVDLGDNDAAQLHAEASLEGCFASHWGLDGLKPSMRYSLAGGYQSNGENVSGSDYCIRWSDGYRSISSVDQEIKETMEGWMSSPGHRRNILDKRHKKVNIGLAWDRYNFKAIQHFEGDYAEYDRLPDIENGVLSFEGRAKNGVTFRRDRDLGVQVYYDPPPHALTRGQLTRTYCYGSGLQIAALRPPISGNSYYSTKTFTTTRSSCPDPYAVPADATTPRSPEEANRFWEAAYSASQRLPEQSVTVPWITASEWTARGDAFAASVRVSDLLARYGSGVYSLIIWGRIDGEDVVISEHSIFHGVVPPDTYSSDR